MQPSLLELLGSLDDVFAELEIRWYLFGAQAAILYGAARLTADVDVTVKLGEVSTASLATALTDAGFELRFDDREFVEQTRVLPIFHCTTGMAVDLVLAGPGLEELFLQRRHLKQLGGRSFPVVGPEDLIVLKTLAGRRKDFEDVLAVLAANQGRLNLTQVRKTLEMLEKALGQSNLLPQLENALQHAGNQ